MSGMSVLGAALVFCPALLQGSGHGPLPVRDLAATSALAGVAVVDRLSTFRDPENGAIYTDAYLRIEELWKGKAGPEIRLRQYGGRLGDRRAAIPGLWYDLERGERIVIFAVPFRDGSFTLKGSRQGLYRVSGGRPPTVRRDIEAWPGPPMTLDALKREVLAALDGGRPPEPSPEVPAPGAPPAPGEGSGAEGRRSEEASARSAPVPVESSRWGVFAVLAAGTAAVALTLWRSRRRRTHEEGSR